MDIHQEVSMVTMTCPKGLETLHTLLKNLAAHPEEHKYRSVSVAALQKRGLSLECFNILLLCGFEDVGGRFELIGAHPENQPFFREAFHAVSSAVKACETSSDVAAAGSDGDVHPHAAGITESFMQMGFTAAQVQRALGRSPPGSDMDTILQILLAPSEDCDADAAAQAAPQSAAVAAWECPICFTQECDRDWGCPNGHSFCAECMLHHVDAVPFPRCPLCDYSLVEEDFVALDVPHERLDAFRRGVLSNAVDSMACDGEILVRCSRPECSNAVLMQRDQRQAFCCHACGADPFCTRCRQAPFHFHGSCGQVQPLREQWAEWISGGREDYHGRARIAAQNDSRNRALHEALERHRELEADEQWKAQNCRLCPNCQRPISKVDGCDSMKCGENYHGGDQQPGCGAQFDWASAAPYVAHVRRQEMPPMHTEHTQMRGRSAFHAFTDCAICGRVGFSGLRFRCIHCPRFDVCPDCEPRLGDLHENDHVFQIVFESEFRFSWLPRGTRVRIVRAGDHLPPAFGTSRRGDLEGQFGVVVARRRAPLHGYAVDLELGGGQVVLADDFVEPVLASQSEAEELLRKTMEQDGEAAHQASSSDPPQAPGLRPVAEGGPEVLPLGYGAVDSDGHSDHDFADDSPLSSEEEMPRRVARPRPKPPGRPAQRPRLAEPAQRPRRPPPDVRQRAAELNAARNLGEFRNRLEAARAVRE